MTSKAFSRGYHQMLPSKGYDEAMMTTHGFHKMLLPEAVIFGTH
jgi:hypothetical protein